MSEYTYKDIIIDPKDERARIGEYYYYADTPREVLGCANYNDNYSLSTLTEINESNCPFTVSGCDWACIIRKKKSSYEERQAEWIKTNDIKVGDKVKIIKEFSLKEGFVEYMKPLVGTIGEIKAIIDEYIQVYTEDKDDWWCWHYDCLEKVKEPKYIPFDLSKEEDRAKLRGAWVRKKEAPFLEQEIAGLSTNVQLVFLNDVVSVGVFNLLEEYEFTDGTPCGKIVEDK